MFKGNKKFEVVKCTAPELRRVHLVLSSVLEDMSRTVKNDEAVIVAKDYVNKVIKEINFSLATAKYSKCEVNNEFIN